MCVLVRRGYKVDRSAVYHSLFFFVYLFEDGVGCMVYDVVVCVRKFPCHSVQSAVGNKS